MGILPIKMDTSTQNKTNIVRITTMNICMHIDNLNIKLRWV